MDLTSGGIPPMIRAMERYFRVHGRKNVERILEAVKASGGTIISAPDPSIAPFQLTVRTAAGEILDLVCYAFTANEYRQRGRPAGEHRFQVKYGSDFKRAHTIYVDSSSRQITLMFGVHEDFELFVAVDPSAHTPTWFSSSVEFKETELKKAAKSGWHGWERDRILGGRRRAGKLVEYPDQSATTEVVIAFRPEHFLDFAKFERIACGIDAGERLLLSDRVHEDIQRHKGPSKLLAWPPTSSTAPRHPLLKLLGLTADELFQTLESRFRLLAAVRGSVAEVHLGRHLKDVPGISSVQHIDQDGQPDFLIQYKNKSFRIECKNVLRKLSQGVPRVDFQKTRASKSDPCSRYYARDQFEVLAACLHPVTSKWEFTFCATSQLPAHNRCVGRLSDKVLVRGKSWDHSLIEILENV